MQIDVENAERFDINYVDKDDKPQRPLLLHASISGSIDRNLYALLELQARKMQQGDAAQLPYWLCPTQVRLIPVADRHLARCREIASQLKARVEIDDRKETVGRKIRDAEINWVPFVGMVGDKELENLTLAVRERGVAGQKELTPDEFSRNLEELQQDRPFEPLSWPELLSKQPRFR